MPIPFRSKTSAPEASENPPWHPNFRNYERLPDIKAVRTVFFVNAAAITVAIAFLAYVVYSEYSIHTVRNQIGLAEADIQRNRVFSEKGVRMYTQFEAEEKKTAEVSAFLDSRPQVAPLLLHIAQTLPKNIALTYFEMREGGLVIRGVVRGAPELASGMASAYVAKLKADKRLSPLFDEVGLTNLNKNAQDGRLNFELSLRLKEPKAKK